MSKHYEFLPQILTSFFQIPEKLETYRNSNLTNYKRPSFGDDMNITFISLQHFGF